MSEEGDGSDCMGGKGSKTNVYSLTKRLEKKEKKKAEKYVRIINAKFIRELDENDQLVGKGERTSEDGYTCRDDLRRNYKYAIDNLLSYLKRSGIEASYIEEFREKFVINKLMAPE